MSQVQKPKKQIKKSFTSKQSEKTSVKKPNKKPTTRTGKILRGPLFWIIAAIFAVTALGQISSAGNKYTQIETSQAIDAISKTQVLSAEIVDRQQKIRLILTPGNRINGADKVEAFYVARQEPTIIDALTGNPTTTRLER